MSPTLRTGRAAASPCGFMRLDPNTHAYVVATAFFTSVAFAIFALNLIALVLQRILA
jgi:hypothetical protein